MGDICLARFRGQVSLFCLSNHAECFYFMKSKFMDDMETEFLIKIYIIGITCQCIFRRPIQIGLDIHINIFGQN